MLTRVEESDAREETAPGLTHAPGVGELSVLGEVHKQQDWFPFVVFCHFLWEDNSASHLVSWSTAVLFLAVRC